MKTPIQIQLELSHRTYWREIKALPVAILVAGLALVAPSLAGAVRGQADSEPRDLARRFETLSEVEKKAITDLGEPGFDALLKEVRHRLQTKRASSNPEEKNDFGSHSDFADLVFFMCGRMPPNRTREVIDLLSFADRRKLSEAKEPILLGLTIGGDESITVPMFLKFVDSGAARGSAVYEVIAFAYTSQSVHSAAVSLLSRSSHPDAVAYLMRKLVDPKAEPALRNLAFTRLARTGGEVGLRAVLAAKDRERTVLSLKERFSRRKIPLKPVKPKAWWGLKATRRSSDGVLWGLLISPEFTYSDTWLIRHDGTRWVSPLMMRTSFRDGIPKDWLEKLTADAEAMRDSDGDGLNDVYEGMTGTNPIEKDSDGDGLTDDIDKNPLAAPRELTDEEKVLGAAFEGLMRFVGEKRNPLVVRFPAGVEPFEMFGVSDAIVARKHDPTGQSYRKINDLLGVSFRAPEYDPADQKLPWMEGRRPVIFSKDGAEAVVQVVGGLDHAGYDLRLKRYGAEWIVTNARMAWIE